MTELWEAIDAWLLVAVVVLLLNLIPVVTPPTWSVLAFFALHSGIPAVPLAALGATCAVTGRTTLALVSRRVGARILPRRWRTNIQVLAEAIRGHRLARLSALGVFAFVPVPSDQLFIAVGIARAPLAPVIIAFGSGRFLVYLFWVSVASSAADSLEGVLRPRVSGGVALVLELVSLAILTISMQVDWRRVLRRHQGPDVAEPPGVSRDAE
jgi:membrane protein YqaA with SNARE-associated domain